MRKFKLLAIAAVCTFSTSALAVTLNPGALNTGATGATVLDAETGPFNTTNSQISFASLLDIGGTPGSVGVQSFSESGNFQILNFNPVAGSVSNVTSTYNVYATFKATGTGIWTSAGTFQVTTLASLDTNVYGSKGCTLSGSHSGSACAAGSGLTFADPTSASAATLAQFGITQGNSDLLLGTAALVATGSNNSTNVNLNLAGGTATTNLNGKLRFETAAGTSGATGFWKTADLLSIGSQAGGNDLNTTFQVVGGITRVMTENDFGVNQGGGSLNYREGIATQVPELDSLSLVLVGLPFTVVALLRHRKRTRVAV